MTVLFTICSNNYLAQAKVLMNSVSHFHPAFKLIIGLVDKFDAQIDYERFTNIEIIPAEDLGLPTWEKQLAEYDIIELNTSVKPSFFKFIINKFKEASEVFYFDPDIKVFSPLTNLLDLLKENSILLTPHILSPIELNEMKPQESTFLNHGIYNLGFIGLASNNDNARKMLDWWEDRCMNYCYRDTKNGLFVDQLWMNHVPLFFNNTHILMEYAYNMAPWNLHERKIIEHTENGYRLNDNSILTFYHFSSYDYRSSNTLNKPYYNRYTMHSRPDLQSLYSDYHDDLLRNEVAQFSLHECAFFPEIATEDIPDSQIQTSAIKKFFRSVTPPIIYSAISSVKRSINAGN